MSGFGCSKCGVHVYPGQKHQSHINTASCTTIHEDGRIKDYAWLGYPFHNCLAALTSPQPAPSHEPFPPIGILRKGLERAACDLAGVSGHLESYTHNDKDEYVTVTVIVRKDRP